jgi:hypothetical protein
MTNDNTPMSELEATKALLEVTRLDLEQWAQTAHTLMNRLANALDAVQRLEELRDGAINDRNYWKGRYEDLASIAMERMI